LDIIGVSELFCADRDSRAVLSGYYNIITSCRSVDDRGGVGLCIKDSIREDPSVPHVYESLFIEMETEIQK